MTKFFPVKIFPWLSFSRPVLFPDFFSPDKEFISIYFFNYYYYYYHYYYYYYYYYFFLFVCKIYYYNVFFDVLYLSWLIKAVLTKISKCEGKQGIEKNNNKNDINITRNCTFVNFKNYTSLKTSQRIGFKLVLIISRSKERVFSSFKDFVWFFDHLCYPHWFKAILNQITAPSQVLVHLINLFCA